MKKLEYLLDLLIAAAGGLVLGTLLCHGMSLFWSLILSAAVLALCIFGRVALHRREQARQEAQQQEDQQQQ